MKRFAIGLFFAAAVAVSAQNLLKNGGFEQGASHWTTSGDVSWQAGNWSVADHRGSNGTRALLKERKLPGEYVLLKQEIPVVAGETYEFGGSIRPENLSGSGAGIAIEWADAETGKHAYGAYLPLVSGNSDFRNVSGLLEVRKGARPYRYFMTLYVNRESLGAALFDDLYVRPAGGRWNAAVVSPPEGRLSTDDAGFELSSLADAPKTGSPLLAAGLKCRVAISGPDGRTLFDRTLPVERERIQVPSGRLPAGEYSLKLQLLDSAGRQILAEKAMPLGVDPAADVAGRKVAVDRHGRLIVAGKPFLPIGIYKHRLTSRAEVDTLAGAGFNTVCVYMGHELKPEILDYCAERGLRVIPSIKDAMPPGATHMILRQYDGLSDYREIAEAIIRKYREHPALLAWYIADELDSSYAPLLRARHEQVQKLDPDHPTFSVFYQHFPEFAGCQTIMGVDPYPVTEAGSHRMDCVRDQMLGAGRVQRSLSSGAGAIWAVPQYFNFGSIKADAADPEVYRKNYRYPTATELRAMIVLEMILGAKGFIGFNYDFMHYRQKIDPDQFRNFWPVVGEAVRFQHEMAPFLLSTEPAPRVTVERIEGEVHAAAFRHPDGRIALLAAAVGPGKSAAKIRLEGRPEVIVFHGNDIDSLCKILPAD